MGILFCIALLLAWPTMGISLLAWIALAIFRSQSGGAGLLQNGILAISADRIAQKAASARAFHGGVRTAFGTAETVESYFRKYGSTEKKFDFHPQPPFYIGYVKIPGNEEFLSVVLMQNDGSVVASFWPDFAHGQDLLGLMGKKLFADDIASQFIYAGR